MIDNQPPERILFEPDPMWNQYPESIREFAYFLKDVKTTQGAAFMKKDFLQIMQGLKLVDFPRLREFFRGVISLMEVDAAFLTKENSPLSNRITQQVILRALGLKLDAVFKAKYPSEEGKGSDDYKVFYERMLGGLEGLKNQGEKNSLPNLVGSVVQIYTNSLNSAFGKNLRLDLKSLQTSLSTNFQTNPNYYQIYISQIPKIEPSQA